MIFSHIININFFSSTPLLEVKSKILAFNPSKAIGPICIPIKILIKKLLINDLSSQLTELFKLSFSRELILKTSKAIPAYKKDSKLNCSNYRPISLLSITDKVLERLM